MKQNISLALIFFIALISLSGCQGMPTKSRVDKISDAESTKYIDNFLLEYNDNLSKYRYNPTVKWLQASNKKEACKVFVEYSGVDITLQNSFKINWDGDCTDGYASGLGREFLSSTSSNISSIAVYKDSPRKKPQYFIQHIPSENITIEGDINNHYQVATFIKDDVDFNYVILAGFASVDHQPRLLTTIHPVYSSVSYRKNYPGFSYLITDYSRDEFADTQLEAVTSIHNDDANRWESSGFTIQVTNNNMINQFEASNGQFIRDVELPKSYKAHLVKIKDEVRQAGLKALEAQKKAIIIKEQYKAKVCNDNITVDFMDNYEYKAICKEGAYYADLQRKVDSKIAERNQQLQQQRTAVRELQNRANEDREIQEQHNNNSISALEGLVMLMQAFSDGVNGSSSRYSIPAYQAPSLPDLQVQSSSPTYNSTTGNNYKYDLNKPSDRVLYSTDIKAQIMDGINPDPTIGIDRSLGQHGGGIQ